MALLLESNLPTIVNNLYSKRIISRDVREEAMTQTLPASVRTMSLLNAVEAKITTRSQTFIEFVKILESEPSLTSQATELVKIYLHGKLLRLKCSVA